MFSADKNSSICYNFTDDEWFVREENRAKGISSLVCLCLLIPTLVMEVYFIRRHKSTFLLRMFFYLTITSFLIDSTYALQYIITDQVPSYAFHNCWNLPFDCVVIYAVFVELLLVLSVNLIILRKMYAYLSGKRLNATAKQQRERRYKYMELLFVVAHFGCPFPLIVIHAVAIWKRVQSEMEIVFLFVPGVIDLVLSSFNALVLMLWFCRLYRRRLLRNKMKLICREMCLVVGSLMVFVLLWGISAGFDAFWDAWLAQIILDVIFPMVHALTPFPFLVYMCVVIRGHKRRKVPVRISTKEEPSMTPSTPPSSRVSLPSDTADHAPNFLSPSTAEPSISEVTPLVN